MHGTPPAMRAVSIVITRYAESDALVSKALAAACAQAGVAGEVLFIEQMEEGGIREERFAGGALEMRILRRKVSGLSEARNLGIGEARHPVVLFLDADAVADPDWAATMAQVLAGDYAIAGSRIRPGWPGAPPFFARAGFIVDQYSMLDLGTKTVSADRVVGAAFGFDRDKLPGDLRFSSAYGRREGKLFSGEETELCARARERGLTIAYVGETSVLHLVAPERARLSWIWRRFYYAGYSRARQGGLPAPANKRGATDWLFLPLVLPPYALGWLRGRFSR